MSGLELLELAKVKPGPKPDPEKVRSSITGIRSRPEWKEALEAAAKRRGTSVGELIDKALAAYFREHELGELPKR